MDRRWRRAATLVLFSLFAGGVVADGAPPPLRALRWLAPGADPVAALGFTPTECLAPAADPQAALMVEIGRAAFRTPVLLGGPAARAGLTCESCHRSGRGAPDFSFPGVSGAPGTADVTSSLFSSHRGDGVDNPAPIPDLSGPKARLKVAQAPATGALEPFIRGLVVEEFDGPPPPPAVLAGLAAYVRALDPAACPARALRRADAGALLEDARRAVRAARTLEIRHDRYAAVVMVAAARARLGAIDERYGAPGLRAERAALRAADRRLARAAQALRDGRPDAGGRLDRWLLESRALEVRLARTHGRSLFDPGRLALAVRKPLPRQGP